MAYTIKKNTKIAIEREVTQGTYVTPSNGASFIQVKEDGLEMTPSKELLERNVLGMGLSKAASRSGLKSVSGSIPVEMKAGSNEGSTPEWGLLLESLLGSVKSTAEVTTGIGNTASVLKIADGDIAKFAVGDVVVVKKTGAYHISPIASKVTTPGAASITLLVAGVSFPDAVKVAAKVVYQGEDSGHPSFSATKYVEDAVKETAEGCITTSMSLDSFTTGQLANLNFAFEGLNFDRSLAAPAYVPSFDTSESPIILNACIYMDGVKIEVNEFTLSVENTLGFIQNTCAGKTASRVTARTVSGSINPYKQDNSISNYTKYLSNTPFSLFIRACNPKATAGEVQEVISIYLPNCVITELAETDSDGVLQETLSFNASTKDGTLSEIYISLS